MSAEVVFFKESGFNLWNVNDSKAPVTFSKGVSKGIVGWQSFGEKEFGNLDVDFTKNIGFCSGFQYKSKRDIIVLDFDIFSKGVKNDEVAKYYEDFLRIDIVNNLNKKGHFNTSTCGNKGVFVDITSNREFCNYIYGLNLCKVTGGLEIMIKNNVVLPPSITVCKNCNTTSHKREFIEEIGVTTITPETEKFLRDYIDTKRKKQPTKHEVRDTKGASKGLIHYNNIVNSPIDANENKPSYACILDIIGKILTSILRDYQGWFFLTSSIINSYGNSLEYFELYDKICKNIDGYNYDKNIEFWKTVTASKYTCYNYKAIIKCANFYDSLTTYCILGEEQKKNEKLKQENEFNEKYNEWKTEFEKTHAKILSPLNFLDVIDGKPDFITQSEFKQRYAEKSTFIEKWIKDDNKRSYKRIIFKPNATELENKENYNLFNGYRIDKLNIPIDTNANIKPILEFINLIAGNKTYTQLDYNNVSFKLLMAFIIKMIKYKEQPKISIVLRSVRRQGVGKGTFYNLLKAMIGAEYCLETGDFNDLFGNFNDGRVNKILIALDECSGSDTFQVTGKIKNAITENSFMANPKYGKKYELDNFNTFLFYSNNERCINVEVGNRRFWVIDVPSATDSNYLVNFNKNVLENDTILKAFYNYIVTKAEKDFNIDFNTYNFEDIIKNHENKSTKNLKQVYAKDLFLFDLYNNIIRKRFTKRENIPHMSNDYNNEEFISYNKPKTYCFLKANLLYDEYKYFFTKSNISKDGGNCGSNQAFYKSLEFYEFLKPKKYDNNNMYLIKIEEIQQWYDTQFNNDNFNDQISDDELCELDFEDVLI